MQIRATDGLVNFYLPGYVKHGLSASLQRVGTSIKGQFTDTNDQVIDPYIKVRPDVIAALGQAGARRQPHGLARQRRARDRHSARPGGGAGSGRGAALQGHRRDLRIADRAAEDPR